MAGMNRRPPYNDRRRSSDIYDRRDDRDRPPRDVDYRYRNSDRFRISPREPSSRRSPYDRDDSVRSRERDRDRDRDRDRNRDGDRDIRTVSSRQYQGKSHAEKAISYKVNNASDQASRTTFAGTSGATTQHPQAKDAKDVMEIIAESVHYRLQLQHAEKKHESLKNALDRSSVKHAEFPSAGELARRQLQSCENEIAKLKQQGDRADQKLPGALLPFFKKQTLTSPDGHSGTQSPQEQALGSIPGLEARLMELQKSTSTLFKNQLDAKLNKMRLSLERQASSNDSEVQELKNSLDEEKQKNRALEDRLDKFERKLDGANKASGICITGFEQKFSKELSSNEEALKKIRESVERHAKQLADLKSTASVATEPSAPDERLEATIVSQDRRISSLRERLEPALADIELLRRTSASTAQEVRQLATGLSETKAQLERQATAISGRQQQEESLMGKVSSFSFTLQGQGQKQEVLEGDVSSLSSTLQGQRQKQEALEGEVSSLRSTVRVHEEKQESLVADAASLRAAIAGLPTEDAKRLFAEFPPAEDLKQLLTELPKLRERPTGVDGDSSPAPLSEVKVTQTVNPKFEQMERRIREGFNEKFSIMATGMGQFLDAERVKRGKVEADIKGLNERMLALKQAVDDDKTAVTQMAENLDKRVDQQAGRAAVLKSNVASLSQMVEMTRSESKSATDDLQMQLGHFSHWASNLSTKNWFREVVEQIHAYVPTHLGGLIDNLTARVEALENRDNHPEGVNKKRKMTNGNPVVMNGNY